MLCVVASFFLSSPLVFLFYPLSLAFRFHSISFIYFSAHTENMRFDWSYKCGYSTGDVACTLYIHNKKAFNSHLRIYNRVCKKAAAAKAIFYTNILHQQRLYFHACICNICCFWWANRRFSVFSWTFHAVFHAYRHLISIYR